MEYEQFGRYQEIVARQEEAFLDQANREKTLSEIVDRHSAARGREDTTFLRSIVATASIADPVLIVAEELLVRSCDATRAAQVLKDADIDFKGPDEVTCGSAEHHLAVSVLRLSPKNLATAATTLHSARIEASFNHLLPAGPVVKAGGAGPGRPSGGVIAASADPSAGQGVVVAVIDTGIAEDSDSIHASVLGGVADTAENTDPLDALAPVGLDYGAGHGTFVAGLIRQVAPAADVRVYRALDSDGIGSEVDVACAMLRAALTDGAHIVNLSLGQQSFSDRPPVALAAALEMLPDEVVIIAAAGNDDSTRPCWPAAFRRVVAVGARSPSGRRAPYSNHGSWLDASTLGSGVVSTYVRGKEELTGDDWSSDAEPIAIWSGTSFAAPQIAGLVAAGVATHGSPRAALDAVLAAGWPEPDMGVTIESPLRP